MSGTTPFCHAMAAQPRLRSAQRMSASEEGTTCAWYEWLREVRRGAAALRRTASSAKALPRGLRRVEQPGRPYPRRWTTRAVPARRSPPTCRPPPSPKDRSPGTSSADSLRLLVSGAAAVGGGGVRTAVARGEVHRDPLHRGELEQVVVLGDRRRGLRAGRAVQRAAPGIGDDLREVMRDQIGERGEQIRVLTRVGAVVEDSAPAGAIAVCTASTSSELLGAPLRRPTARVRRRSTRTASRFSVYCPEAKAGRSFGGRPRIRIGEHRRRVVRVEDRHRRAAPRMPLRAVRGPQLGRRVPAHRVRLVHAPEGRIRRISLLTVRRRARRRNQRPGRRPAPIPAVSVPTTPTAPQILRSRSRRITCCARIGWENVLTR